MAAFLQQIGRNIPDSPASAPSAGRMLRLPLRGAVAVTAMIDEQQ